MRIKFNVTGMTRAACSARVEKVTNAVEGVQKAEVNLLGGTMMVEAAGDSVVEPIIKAITDSGYGAALAGEKTKIEPEKPGENPEKEMKKQILKIDKNRAKYYNYYTGNEWSDKINYDLCINTTDVVIKEIVPVIAKIF